MSRRSSAPRGPRRGGGDNGFRIIGGRHRGRRLHFPDVPGLRPSPDRVRETLFNWLGNDVPGARCLDLFAGSGALGLEALSRGAAAVSFVDRSRAATDAIAGHLATLHLTERGRVVTASAEDYVASTGVAAYDIVFLDPPFADNAWERLCTLLDGRDAVHPGSLVYLEFPAGVEFPAVPAHWHQHKRSRAGRVAFALVKVGGGGDEQAAGES